MRETVAAGFGLGVVFASAFGPERRFHAMEFADAAMSVGEYAACLSARRHMALVGAFMAAAGGAGRATKRS